MVKWTSGKSERTLNQNAANGRKEPSRTGLLCRSESRLSERLGEQNPIADINFIVSNFVTTHVRICAVLFKKALKCEAQKQFMSCLATLKVKSETSSLEV